jgi:hypothetical protein
MVYTYLDAFKFRKILLPSDMPKCAIYCVYDFACNRIPMMPVGKTTLYNLWNSLSLVHNISRELTFHTHQTAQNILNVMRTGSE